MKIKVAIWDMDENYVRRLLQNFQIYYSEKLELGVFLDAETLHRSIREKQIDMLLIDSRIKIDKNFLPQDSGIIIARLCDSSDIEELEGNPAICKYQKIDVLFKEILSIYADQSPMVTIKKGGVSSKISLFCSAQGGSGVSSVSAAYALHTARKGKAVCYLNLEPFGASENYFFSDGSTNFSDVIYALKSRKSNLIMKLESMIKTDRSGVDFFDSCRNAYDMQDLKDEEVARLIQGISQLREYSDIIIDVSGDLGSRMLLLMQEYADTIICVNDGSSVGNRKFLRLYEALRIYEQRTEKKVSEKISLLYNQFDSKAGQQIENSPVPVIGKISFYEGCADRILLEQIEKNPVMGKI